LANGYKGDYIWDIVTEISNEHGDNYVVPATDVMSDLPDDDVRSIAIDSQGNKWIGTIEGLAKFDGLNWTVYTTYNSGLPDNWIQEIAFDNQDNKWICTKGGGLAIFNENGIPWSINENINTSFTLFIYPNPADKQLLFTTGNGKLTGDITVYNLHGQKVIIQKSTENKLDISNLIPGVYILTATIDKKSQRVKFIKK